MKDEAIVEFFMGQGWKPKFTLKERELEVLRLIEQEKLSRVDAEFMVDDEIQSDLECWLMLKYTDSPLS
jgi:hypothetical protein